jgi:hypothetical protein
MSSPNPRYLGDDVHSGMRVRVVQDPDWPGPWRQEFLGTIVGSKVPFGVVDLATSTHPNVADADRGPMRQFFVRFDEPQDDNSDDGPYSHAVIWEKYLRPAD